MLDYIYPEEEQRFFTDREHYLALLGMSRELLAQGVRKHVALSGFRRVGKTVILRVAPYRSADGQVEVDALAEDGERWAVEIKWRGRLAGLKEVQQLARAARSLSARAWFISRAGFTPEAQEYARREGIMVSARREIEGLARSADSAWPGPACPVARRPGPGRGSPGGLAPPTARSAC